MGTPRGSFTAGLAGPSMLRGTMTKRNFLIGIVFGITYWIVVNLGVIGYGYDRFDNNRTCVHSSIRVNAGDDSLVGVNKINYVNTISYEIKAKRFEPQPLQQDGVGLSSEASYIGQTVKEYIRQVFGEDGETWALCVCDCESSYRVSVVSSAGYVGLFQYEERTFYTNGGIDIFDWQEQVRLTKKLYDKGEQWRWPVCNKGCVEKQ